MLKLATLLLSSKVLTRRKVRPRFFYIVLSIIIAILFIALWVHIAPAEWVTSPYMKAVFCEVKK